MSRQCAARMFRISIHAPLRGRPRLWLPCARCFYFNPRPLAGATGREPATMKLALISIHAPLRGRPASGGGFGDNGEKISIHAPLRGRLPDRYEPYTAELFQSTPPCGGDISMLFPLPGSADFNPRPLAGATLPAEPESAENQISIHAPLRGRPFASPSTSNGS